MKGLDENGVGYLMSKIKELRPYVDEESGTLYLTAGGEAYHKVERKYTNPTSVTLSAPDQTYILFSNPVTCTIGLEAPEEGIEEVTLEMDITSSTNPTITFPNYLNWGSTPSFVTGKHYEVSIKRRVVNSVSKYFAAWSEWNL